PSNNELRYEGHQNDYDLLLFGAPSGHQNDYDLLLFGAPSGHQNDYDLFSLNNSR
ncbi:15247_t:CDS:1, partial [Racocetra persica]